MLILGKLIDIEANGDDLGKESQAIECNACAGMNPAVEDKDDNEEDGGPEERVSSLFHKGWN
jgi:hypothetical protein